jgi:gluconate 5-dehydrogenase
VNTLTDIFGLQGSVAVVTGASSGLGIEFASVLASAGADVALIARRKERLEELASEISAQYGVRALSVPTDLTSSVEREAAFERIEKELGGVDILVNNAGIAPTGKAETQWPEAWNDTIEVNQSALFHCCLLARRSMGRGDRPGRVINIASIFGHLGSSLFRVAAYAATKGAVENLTRQLAVEWAGENITVNAIAPAWFPSEMTAGSMERESIVEKMGASSPMNRMGRSGELRSACLFFAAPASSYVTGVILPVDGGYSAW